MCEPREHAAPTPAPPVSSRRRRLWQLDQSSHCPLIGVGLPLPVLRKLVEKLSGGKTIADDYEIHVGAVSECSSRNRLSEALQKELDQRYATVLLRYRAVRDPGQLFALWRAAIAAGDVAGAFWAALTHPRCTGALEQQLCRDLHMVQHQAGACVRADLGKFNALVGAHARLTLDLGKAQQRVLALLAEKSALAIQQENRMMQMQASLIGKDSLIASLQQQVEQLSHSQPGLDSRLRLTARLEQMEQHKRALRQQVADLQLQLAQSAQPAAQDHLPTAGQRDATASSSATPATAAAPVCLQQRAVLCVGGRSGNVATYRSLIEREGARFSHHDGGLEDNASRLDASLAAADLVICQTGCISHSAYWRVKDHCKRHGKRCVFIDNPSISSLARGLQLGESEANN
ncbi:DUF2325 domain-containing protein [Duganella qianjiadongensis]|uniref:DUF2325 domain-containing protein n=1 Tax=Duganella qianjiadongensis TaxID=2692176 RepID=A0ABW9VFS8_9BURK|nr:DUF2325 domain-containing protein [Duganella qianjiadongensis]MYM38313.1 DUF2325 domain-containing protein [Duganella qianjiadongensis]